MLFYFLRFIPSLSSFFISYPVPSVTFIQPLNLSSYIPSSHIAADLFIRSFTFIQTGVICVN